ncbi:UbiH/UbiF/VisC/COQ6 family ubiquinone biosynthesis hydroxylase [Thiofilum flexile]|uniref:UbiH/UbiF/VisC/COQ6 family ubiquinone biosynthesis hydroxylase n=1 Tax=Thiofilum flexile TaxID=125627 RepID=UPI0003628D93|nr:UbiH/UbiF/VisC/COQ6 family ubiquinone biosynthesis hydroxylase [Thiofilum flexile]
MSEYFDVVIVGGGMVGGALAALLGQAGKRVAVLETALATELEPNSPYELRVSALSRASEHILRKVKVWEGIVKRRSAPYESMVVWDSTGSGEIRFDAADLGETDLGHIIENRVIQLALQERLLELDAVKVFSPVQFKNASYTDKGLSVELSTGQILETALLVGADGAKSAVRDWAAIDIKVTDYAQQGLVCVVQTELPHQWTAWQRFMPTGPLAFLPLPDPQCCSIVWTLPADQADAYVLQAESLFKQHLAQALDYRLGQVLSVSERAAFPLKGRHAAQYCAERVVLVGDAAHTIHPLAGQGVNLGLKDVAELAEQLLQDSQHWASFKVLRRYERARKADNALTLHSMEGFSLLFGNNMPVWQLLRNQGLSLVNQMSWVKGQLARHALGVG